MNQSGEDANAFRVLTDAQGRRKWAPEGGQIWRAAIEQFSILTTGFEQS